MRQHPISPVTESTQYRAIGVVRGLFEPLDPDQPTRGVIRTADGTELEAVVLGRLLTLLRRHLNPSEPHLWVVYPRCREPGKLHLQMVGVWEPSTLTSGVDAEAAAVGEAVEAAPVAPPASSPASSGPATLATAARAAGTSAAADAATAAVQAVDRLPEGDDYFSIRGELIFTRPETGDLVVKVRQQPRADGTRPTPFKLQLRGDIPLEHLRHFVSLDVRRQGQDLGVEAFEVIAPINQRGNRGGKARRGGGGGGGGERSGRVAGGGAGSAGGVKRPASGGQNPGRDHGRDHGRAISRPSR